MNGKKKFSIFLIFIGLVSVGIGTYLSFNENNNSKLNVNHKGSNIKIDFDDKKDNGFVITKEERYVDNTLMESVTYNYDENDIIKSMSMKYNCSDYDHCGYMELYAIGLYNYKYKISKNNKLENLIVADYYSSDDYSIYYNDSLKPKEKYGYDELFGIGEDDKSIKVKYDYDSSGKLTKRTAYYNPDCNADNDCTDKTAELNSTVTFKYDDDNITEQVFMLKKGTTYKNNYLYDDHNNVTEFTVDYLIKSDDNIIVDSDSMEGTDDYSGKLIIKYDYKYNNDLIETININVNFNNKYFENYIVKREYDENKNMVLENVDEIESNTKKTENVYKRKIYYKQMNRNIEDFAYLRKMNQIQTSTDSLAEYLYKEDNWLSIYHFYL